MPNVVQYLFEHTAELNKDFVLGKREVVSFSELYIQSFQMASYLSTTYGSQNNIVLVSDNNRFFLITYLGIMLSGNICVPLDPSIEKDNFEYIMQKINGVACFMEKRVLARLSPVSEKTITEQEYIILIEHQDIYIPPHSFNSGLPAQIIFTSGSTGRPMGVVLSHRNIISNTNSIIKYLKLNENDIMEVVLPFYYCYGLSLLHTHLRVGGSLVLNNNFILTATVIKDINQYKCTGFAGVPSHFQILLRKSPNFKKTEFPDLRYVTQAGGKLHTVFIEEFINSFPDIHFYVMYGQTEATARLSYLDYKELDHKIGSIGKGIPDVKLQVVDEENNPVKPGEIGEIIAQGENIMLGYYNDLENTKKVIRNGWLYTGDMGTTDSEGYIYLTARKKEIIKIMGKRVSPKEIEEVLVSFPDVVDCTVELIHDNITGEGLKATVVLKDNANGSITADMLKSYCSSRLAHHKIPKVVEFPKSLKVSSTGKKVKEI